MLNLLRRIARSSCSVLLLTLCIASIADAASTSRGTLQFSSSSYGVSQTAGRVTVSITRINGSYGAVSVRYATANGTAIAGTNYTAASGKLSWASGDASTKKVTITISPVGFAGTKTFKVSLSSIAGAAYGKPTSTLVSVVGSGSGSGGTGGAGTGPAAKLAAKLGRPSRLLVGLGGQGANDPVSAAISQGLKPDFFDEYLVNAGSGDWTTWNSPAGSYVGIVASKAEQMGAIPMFTLYQMATNGEANMSSLTNSAFMTRYWSNVRLMYQQLAMYGKPAVVNLEPDFWGYAQKAAGSNPKNVAALVKNNADCASLTNDIAGIAGCLVKMARQYAPQAYVGFPPSDWGADGNVASVVAWMNAIGAQNADFIVMQTSDRDAGCFEVNPQPYYCARTGAVWYWDESNTTTPNFKQHLASTNQYHTGIGNLPVIWWQMPMGVPSQVRGGTNFHFRDNREHYFLTHPAELTAVGGLGVVFGAGENNQTTIVTDGGQYQSLSKAYLAAPAPLP